MSCRHNQRHFLTIPTVECVALTVTIDVEVAVRTMTQARGAKGSVANKHTTNGDQTEMPQTLSR